MGNWLRDLLKAFLIGCAAAAVLFAVSFLIGMIAGGVDGGLEAAKTVLLLAASLGMFLLAGLLLMKGKKPERFSAEDSWRKHFRAAGLKSVLAACCLAALLAAAAADYLLWS